MRWWVRELIMEADRGSEEASGQEAGEGAETETFGLEVSPAERAKRIRRILEGDAVPIHLILRTRGIPPGEP